MLRVKLTHLDREVATRRKLAKLYLNGINNALVQLPQVRTEEMHVWHLFVVRCKRRHDLQRFLADQGVQTLIHYPIPPHKQHAYKAYGSLSLPLTEAIHSEVLSLPISPVMTEDEVNVVIRAVNAFA